ncbi:hypothetical protein TBLA_0B04030 [Henningerozyma blattae CBS 6284]|uniref:[acyl-carrier-protein] S-malonyltransferase n=1 Tax=Henningerozyma blattae (strain ATCC 34711 / CBS 6284 / DSM 70876 / NBRC 10599 / NRRL Y-10934 / UCD 77-7) TaxID=1071380 RepID=I2GYN9_HENB6|nr:hypothetical protein TBLA_0B04030 [Tetrapisispora blattae CBS 6284]CCH59241.1 hypothetical protein TBLA_0B04030 [Tetrapisispora blattae CBS 6284]
MLSLFTFPGQGSSANLLVFKSLLQNLPIVIKQKQINKELLNLIFQTPTNPGSKTVISALLFHHYTLNHNNTFTNAVSIGHSLGELSCLTINGLFNLQDAYEIANYRNDMMIKHTLNYLMQKKALSNEQFELVAILNKNSKKFDINLPEVEQLINNTSITIANINSKDQIVLTGLSKDIEILTPQLPSNLKLKKLINPNNIPFHNNAILNPLRLDLKNFMYTRLNSNVNKLKIPIISNYNCQLTESIDSAIENFIDSTVNTVQFNKSIDKLFTDNNTQKIPGKIVSFGPGNNIHNLLKKNLIIPQQTRDSMIDYTDVDSIVSLET